MLITVQPDPNWQLSLAQLSPSLSSAFSNLTLEICGDFHKSFHNLPKFFREHAHTAQAQYSIPELN